MVKLKKTLSTSFSYLFPYDNLHQCISRFEQSIQLNLTLKNEIEDFQFPAKKPFDFLVEIIQVKLITLPPHTGQPPHLQALPDKGGDKPGNVPVINRSSYPTAAQFD